MSSAALSQPVEKIALQGVVDGLTAPTIVLDLNPVAPTPLGTSVDTIVEPVGSWYSPAVATVNDIGVNPDGTLQLNVDSVQFTYSGSDDAETVYNIHLLDNPISAAPVWIAGKPILGGPVTMGAVGSYIFDDIKVSMPLVSLS